VKEYSKVLKEAKTIAWNGPVGFFENELFTKGTIGIADAIAEATKKGAVSVIGGGDSASAAEKFNFAKKVSYVSSGGGASLKLFEGKELVALKALER
jgi:phosphoglycerate kinase